MNSPFSVHQTEDIAFTQLPAAYGRTVELDHQTYLFFGGTAYLSVHIHAGFKALYKEGIDRYGINIGTSRNNNVIVDIYQKAEEVASERFGHPAALITSSGFLAAQLAVRYLAGANASSEVLYAPQSHPALWLDQAPEERSTFAEWAYQTVDYINASTGQDFTIVSNTINSLKPEQYTFEAFKQITPGKRLHFLLDDSHGIGVLSPSGALPYCKVPFRDEFKITIVASLAKGLGIDAGIILSDAATITAMKKTPVFLGASPPAPAALYTFIRANDLYREQYEALQDNIFQFRSMLPRSSLSIPHFPVFYIDEPSLFQKLKQKNILISSFSYPHPNDPPFNRIVVVSAHLQEDLEILCKALQT